MALTVEDGTGKVDSDSYCAVSYADRYHLKRGNSGWNDIDYVTKEQCLVRATDFMSQRFGERYMGRKRMSMQALDWPRVDVPVHDFQGMALVPFDSIPEDVKRACAELALRAKDGPLTADLGQAVVKETIGPLTVEYDKASSRQVSYPSIVATLSKYFKRSGNNIKLVRA